MLGCWGSLSIRRSSAVLPIRALGSEDHAADVWPEVSVVQQMFTLSPHEDVWVIPHGETSVGLFPEGETVIGNRPVQPFLASTRARELAIKQVDRTVGGLYWKRMLGRVGQNSGAYSKSESLLDSPIEEIGGDSTPDLLTTRFFTRTG